MYRSLNQLRVSCYVTWLIYKWNNIVVNDWWLYKGWEVYLAWFWGWYICRYIPVAVATPLSNCLIYVYLVYCRYRSQVIQGEETGGESWGVIFTKTRPRGKRERLVLTLGSKYCWLIDCVSACLSVSRKDIESLVWFFYYNFFGLSIHSCLCWKCVTSKAANRPIVIDVSAWS